MRGAAEDFDIRFKGEGFDDIGLGFGFDNLFREHRMRGTFSLATSESAEAANQEDVLTQRSKARSTETRAASASSERLRLPTGSATSRDAQPDRQAECGASCQTQLHLGKA